MTKTVLILPFVVDDTNMQVFLHREVNSLPYPLPERVFIGELPPIAGIQVLEIHQIYTSRFAHQVPQLESPQAATTGPVYDLQNDINYVILQDVPEPDALIPLLLSWDWSDEPLPRWLLSEIGKPRREHTSPPN